MKGTTTMAKNNTTDKGEKQPKDFSKLVTVVKVVALFILLLAALYMVGMLTVGAVFVKVLGYGVMAVTIYFALSVVK